MLQAKNNTIKIPTKFMYSATETHRKAEKFHGFNFQNEEEKEFLSTIKVKYIKKILFVCLLISDPIV
jgi:hypothetical protein